MASSNQPQAALQRASSPTASPEHVVLSMLPPYVSHLLPDVAAAVTSSLVAEAGTIVKDLPSLPSRVSTRIMEVLLKQHARRDSSTVTVTSPPGSARPPPSAPLFSSGTPFDTGRPHSWGDVRSVAASLTAAIAASSCPSEQPEVGRSNSSQLPAQRAQSLVTQRQRLLQPLILQPHGIVPPAAVGATVVPAGPKAVVTGVPSPNDDSACQVPQLVSPATSTPSEGAEPAAWHNHHPSPPAVAPAPASGPAVGVTSAAGGCTPSSTHASELRVLTRRASSGSGSGSAAGTPGDRSHAGDDLMGSMTVMDSARSATNSSRQLPKPWDVTGRPPLPPRAHSNQRLPSISGGGVSSAGGASTPAITIPGGVPQPPLAQQVGQPMQLNTQIPSPGVSSHPSSVTASGVTSMGPSSHFGPMSMDTSPAVSMDGDSPAPASSAPVTASGSTLHPTAPGASGLSATSRDHLAHDHGEDDASRPSSTTSQDACISRPSSGPHPPSLAATATSPGHQLSAPLTQHSSQLSDTSTTAVQGSTSEYAREDRTSAGALSLSEGRDSWGTMATTPRESPLYTIGHARSSPSSQFARHPSTISETAAPTSCDQDRVAHLLASRPSLELPCTEGSTPAQPGVVQPAVPVPRILATVRDNSASFGQWARSDSQRNSAGRVLGLRPSSLLPGAPVVDTRQPVSAASHPEQTSGTQASPQPTGNRELGLQRVNRAAERAAAVARAVAAVDAEKAASAAAASVQDTAVVVGPAVPAVSVLPGDVGEDVLPVRSDGGSTSSGPASDDIVEGTRTDQSGSHAHSPPGLLHKGSKESSPKQQQVQVQVPASLQQVQLQVEHVLLATEQLHPSTAGPQQQAQQQQQGVQALQTSTAEVDEDSGSPAAGGTREPTASQLAIAIPTAPSSSPSSTRQVNDTLPTLHLAVPTLPPLGLAPLRTSAPAVPSTTPRVFSPASAQHHTSPLVSGPSLHEREGHDLDAQRLSPTGSASGLTSAAGLSQPPRTSAPAALAARPGLSPMSAAPAHVVDRGSPVGAGWYTRAGLSLEQLPEFPCTWEQQLVIMSRLPQPQYLHVRYHRQRMRLYAEHHQRAQQLRAAAGGRGTSPSPAANRGLMAGTPTAEPPSPAHSVTDMSAPSSSHALHSTSTSQGAVPAGSQYSLPRLRCPSPVHSNTPLLSLSPTPSYTSSKLQAPAHPSGGDNTSSNNRLSYPANIVPPASPSSSHHPVSGGTTTPPGTTPLGSTPVGSWTAPGPLTSAIASGSSLTVQATACTNQPLTPGSAAAAGPHASNLVPAPLMLLRTDSVDTERVMMSSTSVTAATQSLHATTAMPHSPSSSTPVPHVFSPTAGAASARVAGGFGGPTAAAIPDSPSNRVSRQPSARGVAALEGSNRGASGSRALDHSDDEEEEEGRGSSSGDSSNSEEDVGKAVRQALRRYHPGLQVPLWTLLERHCSEAELLHIAAAMGPAQQRALDSAVTKALTDLMAETTRAKADPNSSHSPSASPHNSSVHNTGTSNAATAARSGASSPFEAAAASPATTAFPTQEPSTRPSPPPALLSLAVDAPSTSRHQQGISATSAAMSPAQQPSPAAAAAPSTTTNDMMLPLPPPALLTNLHRTASGASAASVGGVDPGYTPTSTPTGDERPTIDLSPTSPRGTAALLLDSMDALLFDSVRPLGSPRGVPLRSATHASEDAPMSTAVAASSARQRLVRRTTDSTLTAAGLLTLRSGVLELAGSRGAVGADSSTALTAPASPGTAATGRRYASGSSIAAAPSIVTTGLDTAATKSKPVAEAEPQDVPVLEEPSLPLTASNLAEHNKRCNATSKAAAAAARAAEHAAASVLLMPGFQVGNVEQAADLAPPVHASSRIELPGVVPGLVMPGMTASSRGAAPSSTDALLPSSPRSLLERPPTEPDAAPGTVAAHKLHPASGAEAAPTGNPDLSPRPRPPSCTGPALLTSSASAAGADAAVSPGAQPASGRAATEACTSGTESAEGPSERPVPSSLVTQADSTCPASAAATVPAPAVLSEAPAQPIAVQPPLSAVITAAGPGIPLVDTGSAAELAPLPNASSSREGPEASGAACGSAADVNDSLQAGTEAPGSASTPSGPQAASAVADTCSATADNPAFSEGEAAAVSTAADSGAGSPGDPVEVPSISISSASSSPASSPDGDHIQIQTTSAASPPPPPRDSSPVTRLKTFNMRLTSSGPMRTGPASAGLTAGPDSLASAASGTSEAQGSNGDSPGRARRYSIMAGAVPSRLGTTGSGNLSGALGVQAAGGAPRHTASGLTVQCGGSGMRLPGDRSNSGSQVPVSLLFLNRHNRRGGNSGGLLMDMYQQRNGGNGGRGIQGHHSEFSSVGGSERSSDAGTEITLAAQLQAMGQRSLAGEASLCGSASFAADLGNCDSSVGTAAEGVGSPPVSQLGHNHAGRGSGGGGSGLRPGNSSGLPQVVGAAAMPGGSLGVGVMPSLIQVSNSLRSSDDSSERRSMGSFASNTASEAARAAAAAWPPPLETFAEDEALIEGAAGCGSGGGSGDEATSKVTPAAAAPVQEVTDQLAAMQVSGAPEVSSPPSSSPAHRTAAAPYLHPFKAVQAPVGTDTSAYIWTQSTGVVGLVASTDAAHMRTPDAPVEGQSAAETLAALAHGSYQQVNIPGGTAQEQAQQQLLLQQQPLLQQLMSVSAPCSALDEQEDMGQESPEGQGEPVLSPGPSSNRKVKTSISARESEQRPGPSEQPVTSGPPGTTTAPVEVESPATVTALVPGQLSVEDMGSPAAVAPAGALAGMRSSCSTMDGSLIAALPLLDVGSGEGSPLLSRDRSEQQEEQGVSINSAQGFGSTQIVLISPTGGDEQSSQPVSRISANTAPDAPSVATTTAPTPNPQQPHNAASHDAVLSVNHSSPETETVVPQDSLQVRKGSLNPKTWVHTLEGSRRSASADRSLLPASASAPPAPRPRPAAASADGTPPWHTSSSSAVPAGSNNPPLPTRQSEPTRGTGTHHMSACSAAINVVADASALSFNTGAAAFAGGEITGSAAAVLDKGASQQSSSTPSPALTVKYSNHGTPTDTTSTGATAGAAQQLQVAAGDGGGEDGSTIADSISGTTTTSGVPGYGSSVGLLATNTFEPVSPRAMLQLTTSSSVTGFHGAHAHTSSSSVTAFHGAHGHTSSANGQPLPSQEEEQQAVHQSSGKGQASKVPGQSSTRSPGPKNVKGSKRKMPGGSDSKCRLQ